jgi:hypothetical protein
MTLNLTIDVWSTENRARMSLVAGLEQALSPVEWMFGVRIDLPFYFGARAEYEPISVQYQDSEESATRRYRRAILVVSGRVPVYRIIPLPRARPRVDLVVR